MGSTFTDAQTAEIVKQIRRNKPPSARCPVCDTTLVLEPVVCQLVERDCDDPPLRGVRFDDHWDVFHVGFDCPNCGQGVGHVCLEQRGQRS